MDAFQTVLISSFASIVVAYNTARATSYSKDVIEERQKWRERIRCLTIEAAGLIRNKQTTNQSYEKIYSEFNIRLNPNSDEDNAILAALREGKTTPSELTSAKLLAQVARLLKHDWERAKVEANIFRIFYPKEYDILRLKSGDYMN